MKTFILSFFLLIISNQLFAQEFSMVWNSSLRKYGWKDNTGKEINYKYDDAGKYREGMVAIAVYEKENEAYRYKWGFLDEKGNVAIPLVYQQVSDFNEGFASVKQNDKYGFINKKGEVVVPIKYDASAGMFGSDRVAVKLKKKWWLVDTVGKETKIPHNYKTVSFFADGLAAVENENGLYGYIDINGSEVIPCTYNLTYGFNNDMAEVSIDQHDLASTTLHGMIDKTGKEITPIKYTSIEKFEQGLAFVTLRDKFGHPIGNFLNASGKEILQGEFDKVGRLHNKWIYAYNSYAKEDQNLYDISGKLLSSQGRYSIEKTTEGYLCKFDEKYGFLDTAGNQLIPFIYDEMFAFSSGLARVKSGGKFGYINSKGALVFPLQYDEADDFKLGEAKVKEGGKDYRLTAKGDVAFVPKDPNAFVTTKGDKNLRYGKKNNGKWSIIELNGKPVSVEYDSIKETADILIGFTPSVAMIYEYQYNVYRSFTANKSLVQSVVIFYNVGVGNLFGITQEKGQYGLYLFDRNTTLHPFASGYRISKDFNDYEFMFDGDWWMTENITNDAVTLMKKCPKCKGHGKIKADSMYTEKGEWVPGKTTTITTAGKSNYETKWDPKTNSYKGTRTITPSVTKTETTEGHYSSGKVKIERISKTCTACNGVAHWEKKIVWNGNAYVEMK
ncbi:MAG: WG repeat-containing protein [Bacteroidetes bacterium]|nr:WG repeat-containing protein [Bacteroidota bacterium]